LAAREQKERDATLTSLQEKPVQRRDDATLKNDMLGKNPAAGQTGELHSLALAAKSTSESFLKSGSPELQVVAEALQQATLGLADAEKAPWGSPEAMLALRVSEGAIRKALQTLALLPPDAL